MNPAPSSPPPPYYWPATARATVQLNSLIWTGTDGAIIASATLCGVDHRSWPVKVLGRFPKSEMGATYSVEARWKYSPKYSEWNLMVDSACQAEPTTLAGITDFIGKLDGVGHRYRYVVMVKYGLEAIEAIDRDGVDALIAAGVPQANAEKAISAFIVRRAAWSGPSRVLDAAKITGRLYTAFMGAYGDALEAKVRADPLSVFLVPDVSFAIADRLWAACKVPEKDSRRIAAGANETLKQFGRKRGHSWMSRDELCQETGVLLKLPGLAAHWKAAALETDPSVCALITVDDGNRVWRKKIYLAEIDVCRRLADLLRVPAVGCRVSETALEAAVDAACADQLPTVEQRRALLGIPRARVAVLKGHAGTGKTTTVDWLVQVYRSLGISPGSIQLCAPTAAAARRAGSGASTVHHLLAISSREGGVGELEDIDVIVIDEASMMTIQLTARLLAALPATVHVVFVGDPYQLPAVGAGAVLRDLINSERIPTFDLGRNVKRQGVDSGILGLAWALLDGKRVDLPSDVTLAGRRDVVHHAVKSAAAIRQRALAVWDEHDKRADNVRFITYRWGKKTAPDPSLESRTDRRPAYQDAGVHRINQELVAAIEFTGASFGTPGADYIFYEGMHCLWRKNVRTPGLCITNGETFVVTRLDVEKARMTIAASTQSGDDGSAPSYTVDLKTYGSPTHFIPGYCSTIHSTQGNQYPTVVFIIQPGDYISRECAYTAITRAESRLIIIGDLSVLWQSKWESGQRRSCLTDRLQDAICVSRGTSGSGRRSPPREPGSLPSSLS